MIELLIVLAVMAVAGFIAWKVFARHRPNFSQRILDSDGQSGARAIPSGIKLALVAVVCLAILAAAFNKMFFYAEPGYVYHVRTITGNERVVDGVGYSMHLFGRVDAWKKAMTVQASNIGKQGLDAQGESGVASAALPPLNIMFLDQVDADAMATVRFKLPTEKEAFLTMAHEYRTPDNLLRVALIPSFQETLQATASLMSAEDYYSGGRTEFISEFENQMQRGIYLVERKEVLSSTVKMQTSDADASDPAEQTPFGDQQKTVWKVEKRRDQTGQPIRKEQKFIIYGIAVHEARVTDMRPNVKFVGRMEQKQEASAKRAIAREQKIQEEEQRLLAIAKGDREVAEQQAKMKVQQISATTAAETRKKEAMIEADRKRSEARIQEETAQILLEKSRTDAEAIKVAADAEAYRKQKVLAADNALAQKLDAEIQIQRIWADAFSKRDVPQYVFGSGGGSGGAPVGSDSEVRNFMQLMTLDAAKRLNYERSMTGSTDTTADTN